MNWEKIGIGSLISFFALLIIGLIFRMMFITFVDNYELGYQFDKSNGSITVLPRTGYFIRNPIYIKIHTIDLRPMQVRIEANNRVLNAKLVRFRPEGLMQFIALHGRGDYDAPVSSSNSSSRYASNNFSDIMMCYAYENYGSSNNDSLIEHKYKFIKIMNNTGSTSSPDTQ